MAKPKASQRNSKALEQEVVEGKSSAIERLAIEAIQDGLGRILGMEIPEDVGNEADEIEKPKPPEMGLDEDPGEFMERMKEYMGLQQSYLKATAGANLGPRLNGLHDILSLLVMDKATIINDEAFRARMKQVGEIAHDLGLKRRRKSSSVGKSKTPTRDSMGADFGWTMIKKVKVHKPVAGKEQQVELKTIAGETSIYVEGFALLDMIASDNPVWADEWAYIVRQAKKGSYRFETIPVGRRTVEFYWEREVKDGQPTSHRKVVNARSYHEIEGELQAGDTVFPHSEVVNPHYGVKAKIVPSSR